MQQEMFPLNDLTAILSAGDGPSPLPSADPLMDHVMRHGMSEPDGDGPPGIHISGSESRMTTIAEPSRDQVLARRRSRLGPPPQQSEGRLTAQEWLAIQASREAGQPVIPSYPMAPAYAPALPMQMGAQITVQAVDFNRGVLLTSHGAIPLSPETVNRIMQLSVATMREFFAESVSATMQAYGLGGKRRAKPKRKRAKKV